MPTSTITISNAQQVEFDPALLSRLTRSRPRYTSYSIAERFTASFSLSDYQQAVSHVFVRGRHHPLPLYLHIPFCDTICDYRGCNKIVTRNKEKAVIHLECLKKEMSIQNKLFADANHIEQYHFGGGIPTYLSDEQMQNFDPEVQKVVNQTQPEQQTLEEYYAALDKNELPIARGYTLGMDDVIRRFIMQMLMRNLGLSISSLKQAFSVIFNDYFAAEIKQLQKFINMRLLTIDDQWISVTLRGRLLIRNICMSFDRHLQQAGKLQSETVRFSQIL